jgi:hypothetical protein
MQDQTSYDSFIKSLTPTALQPPNPGSIGSMDSSETTQQQLPAAAPQQNGHHPCSSTPVGTQAGVRRSLFGAPSRAEVDGFLGQLEAQLREEGKLTCPG